MSDTEQGWAAHPDAVEPSWPPVGDGPDSEEPSAPVVGVGALCRLVRQRSDDQSSQAFSVGEFVLLEDGRRVVLHQDRGFTLREASGSDVRVGLTVQMLESTVLNVVLPDDEDSEDEHPWAWLAELAHGHGLPVSAGELGSLRYDVVLADEVRHWLGHP
jgi:hypothetical protein